MVKAKKSKKLLFSTPNKQKFKYSFQIYLTTQNFIQTIYLRIRASLSTLLAQEGIKTYKNCLLVSS